MTSAIFMIVTGVIVMAGATVIWFALRGADDDR